MKRLIVTASVLAVMAASMLGGAGTAVAHPNKTVACKNCHGTYSAQKISATLVRKTGNSRIYKISTPRATAWAVLLGAKNVKHGYGSSGSVTLVKGKTYKLWAVNINRGANVRTLVVK